MSGLVTINLDELFAGDDYNTTIGDIFREEIKREIKAHLARELRTNAPLKRALNALTANAVQKIIAEVAP